MVLDGDSQQFSPENQHCHHSGSLCFAMSCTTSEVDEQQIYRVVFCLERKAQAATHSISLQPGKPGSTAPQVPPEVWVILQNTKETG